MRKILQKSYFLALIFYITMVYTPPVHLFASKTPTCTPTATFSPTVTATMTLTPTLTRTPDYTPTATYTVTPMPTFTPTPGNGSGGFCAHGHDMGMLGMFMLGLLVWRVK